MPFEEIYLGPDASIELLTLLSAASSKKRGAQCFHGYYSGHAPRSTETNMESTAVAARSTVRLMKIK